MVAVELWGNALWRGIHAVALGFAEGTEERRRSPAVRAAYRAWFTSLYATLPCETCRTHFAAHMVHGNGGLLARLDGALADAGNPYALFEWTVDLHNLVSQNGDAWTVERALRAFQNGGAPPRETMVSIGAHGIALAIGFLVAALVIWVVYLLICRLFR